MLHISLCVQCLGSPARAWLPGSAGRGRCPSRRCRMLASTCRRWSARRPTRWWPTSTTPVPARPPAAPTDTCQSEESGASLQNYSCQELVITRFVAGAVQFSESLLNWIGCNSNAWICIHVASNCSGKKRATSNTSDFTLRLHCPNDLSCLSNADMLALIHSSVFWKARISQFRNPKKVVIAE